MSQLYNTSFQGEKEDDQVFASSSQEHTGFSGSGFQDDSTTDSTFSSLPLHEFYSVLHGATPQTKLQISPDGKQEKSTTWNTNTLTEQYLTNITGQNNSETPATSRSIVIFIVVMVFIAMSVATTTLLLYMPGKRKIKQKSGTFRNRSNFAAGLTRSLHLRNTSTDILPHFER